MTHPMTQENKQSEVLALCPFCRGDAIVVGNGPYRVACTKCTAAMPNLYVVTKAEAAAIWNRRPITEAQVEGALDPKGLEAAICQALLNAFPMADKVAEAHARVAVAALPRLSTTEPGWTSRLAHIEQRTPTEHLASRLKEAIERLGGHPLLTAALNAADLAMRTLGKWHDDGEPGAASLSPEATLAGSPAPVLDPPPEKG